jgi:phospholipase C
MTIVGFSRRTILFGVAATVLAGCGGGAAGSPLALPNSFSLHRHTGSSPIQHVVIIVQENRSFNNLFAGFPGANDTMAGKEKVKKGGKWVDKPVKLTEQALLPTPKNHDIGHCYYSFIAAYDGGKMDGFNYEPEGICQRKWSGGGGLPSTYPYQYVNPTDIAPYWDMAEQYVLADAMFQTQGSGSFSAHQDLIRGGTALAGPYGSSASMIDTPTLYPWGCDAPKPTVTNLITLKLKWESDTGPYPCTEDFPYSGSTTYTTLADLLDSAGVSWKYYSPCFIGTPSSAECPSSEEGCKGCAGAELNAFDVIASVRNGKEWGTNVDMPETNVLNDISNGALPAVSWVIPNDTDDDHLGEKEDNGPSWVASVVNAVGQSSYWNSTAIVILWDDWGGLYDNAAPPCLSKSQCRDDQGGLGFRVPMIVVSPYAKVGQTSQSGYVSHTQYEFGSILKYVEQNFGLTVGGLETTDNRAASISDVFDYNQKPRKFTVIPSQHDARWFIAHRPALSHGDPE